MAASRIVQTVSLVVCLVLGLVTGCGSEPSTTTTAPPPPPTAAEIEAQNQHYAAPNNNDRKAP
jgi:hypothetical protein